MAHQDQGGVGEAHPSAGALEQLHAGLAFQHGELLRDGGRRELKRVRHRGDRAALVQLAQQPEAPELEHREETLLDIAHESESILKR